MPGGLAESGVVDTGAAACAAFLDVRMARSFRRASSAARSRLARSVSARVMEVEVEADIVGTGSDVDSWGGRSGWEIGGLGSVAEIY